MITKEHLTKLIVEHVFDDGTGSERRPFIFKQFDVLSRAYHPRYDQWYVHVYDRKHQRHYYTVPIEDLICGLGEEHDKHALWIESLNRGE